MEEIILKQRDFKEKLVGLVNQIELPAFLISPVVKELLEQLTILEEQEYLKALENKKEKIENEED